jgi:hypothetical protein
MRDLTTDLARYGDHLLEITTPVGVKTERPARAIDTAPEPTRTPRPIWIAIAAAATATLIMLLPFLLTRSEQPAATTPIPSTFAWVAHELPGIITFPARFDDGYVALLDGQVAGSPDGTTWTLWPNQPFDPPPDFGELTRRGLSVDAGEVVFIVRRPGPTPRAFGAGSDRIWREITVEPATRATGGDLSITTGDAGLVMSLGDEGWVRSGDGFEAHPIDDSLVSDLGWGQDVEPIWTDIRLPDDPEEAWDIIRAIGEKDSRFVAFSAPDPGPYAWTSTDGQNWTSIDPVIAPSMNRGCNLEVSAITPEIIETGGLGWFAAGSFCDPTVIWHSSDGIDWRQLTELNGIGAFDTFVPIPPVFLIEDEQVFIYSHQQFDDFDAPYVWMGTVEETTD